MERPHLTYPLRPMGGEGIERLGRLRREQRRWIGRVALKLLAIEFDAKSRQHRNLEATLTVEGEGRLGDAVDIGAAADELHQIHIGERRRELQVGGDPE